MKPKKDSFNPQLAEVCGIHAGDGYLRNDGKRKEFDISGGYDEKDYYDSHVIPLFNKAFNLNIKGRYFKNRKTYGFVIRDPQIIRFMHSLGFPYGSKSLIVKIPKFIQEDKKLRKHFLRGYFDTDGHLAFGKRYGKNIKLKINRHCYPRIMLSTVSKNLKEGIKKILAEHKFNFNIYNTKPIKKTENLKYRIELNGIKNINKWINLIGIRNPTKYSRYQIWKKFGFCPTNISFKQRLDILNEKKDPNSFYGPIV